ncbi:hypothetical protein RFI_00766 [Reticulomyxa filosa]|uniref:Aminotransferase class I/classII large domain-containing protein n=1 Tax=Reticulomyxa filosa TaxID=46433 RepID=X6PDL7_RETFI|nr:hypothetical protein RFI_00766 [Reticulomyxa filosa]|eukprot:ETO36296.1 hypothetical protein RFI_00766 [Reticulomyxa filosa]
MFSSGLSPPCVAQVLAAFQVIKTDTGKQRMQRLIKNSNLLRQVLRERGFHVMGDEDSAVVPVIIGHPAKMPAFSRKCLEKGVKQNLRSQQYKQSQKKFFFFFFFG